MTLTPAEIKLAQSAGSLTSWAQTEDRAARTAPARRRFNQRFEEQVDPDRKLDPAERARRADYARRAYFKHLALRSAVSRRLAAEYRDAAEQADVELDEVETLVHPVSPARKVG